MNMAAKAVKSHAEISTIVKPVTTGCCIRTSSVAMVPNDKPTPQLARSTMML